MIISKIRINRWAILVMGLLLVACSSQPQKIYYQLPALEYDRMTQFTNTGRHLWVERVTVADYLNGNGIVYQTNDVQYVMANNNLWASSLEQQLQLTLVANLDVLLPGWMVSSQPAPTNQQTTLGITVTGFHGRADGNAVVSGEWVLKDTHGSMKRNFMITVPQTADGYDALIRSLAVGWQQEATVIAKQVAAH